LLIAFLEVKLEVSLGFFTMVGSSTALLEPAEEAFSSPRLLSSSLGSLPSPRKAKSEVSKVYKHSSELFLTRRLPEAFSAIEPLITVPPPSGEATEDENMLRKAPIAGASRRDRIKVWVLYLTMLNAIADLDAEDGKVAFGNKAWRDVVAKAQNSTIWDEVVSIGYGGVDGNVDADVVISLATLLLAQSTTQAANQQHLESYLAAANNPDLDLVGRLKDSQSLNGHTNGAAYNSNGTDTPRDLIARMKIIELYTLHVLPRNGEWDYARDFISMSEVLDEDMKDSFLQDLRSLEDEESRGEEDFEDALPQQEDLVEQEPRPAKETERGSLETVRQAPSISHHRSNSETDYGIDYAQFAPNVQNLKPPPLQPIAEPVKTSQSKSSRSPPKAPHKASNSRIYDRSIAVMIALQQMVSHMTAQMSQNPMGLLRFVLFLIGIVVALSRQNVKDRLGGMTGAGWDKLRRTIGMGVKVSYI